MRLLEEGEGYYTEKWRGEGWEVDKVGLSIERCPFASCLTQIFPSYYCLCLNLSPAPSPLGDFPGNSES